MKIKLTLLLLLICSFKTYSQTDSLKIALDDINAILKKTVGLKLCTQEKNKILEVNFINSKFDKTRLEYEYVYQEGNVKVKISQEFSLASISEFYIDDFDCQKNMSSLSIVNKKDSYVTLRQYKDDVFTYKTGVKQLSIHFPVKEITFDAIKVKFKKLIELASKVK